jgi:hypothetical protein
MKATSWILIGVVALGGCSKDEAKKAEAPAASTTPPTPPPEPPKPAKKPLAELFPGTAPALPPYTDKVKFGTTEEEAKAAAPAVMAEEYHYDPDDIEGGVEISIHFTETGKRVMEVFVKTDEPVAKLREVIASKWGQPKAVTASSVDWLFWSGPGVRVGLKNYGHTSSEVHYTPELTTEEFYGKEAGLWGFERGKSLVGSTADEVMTTYADWAPRKHEDRSIYLETPAVAGEHRYPRELISIDLEKDKVVAIDFTLSRESEAALLARAEALYGKGKPDKARQKYQPLYIEFKGPPKARVAVEASSEDLIGIHVGKPR